MIKTYSNQFSWIGEPEEIHRDNNPHLFSFHCHEQSRMCLSEYAEVVRTADSRISKNHHPTIYMYVSIYFILARACERHQTYFAKCTDNQWFTARISATFGEFRQLLGSAWLSTSYESVKINTDLKSAKMEFCDFLGLVDNQRITSKCSPCRISATFGEFRQLLGSAWLSTSYDLTFQGNKIFLIKYLVVSIIICNFANG